MTERRETDRTASAPADKAGEDKAGGERIAKFLASAGIASRRDVEKLIVEGRVSVDGRVLETPAFKVTGRERILVDGNPVRKPEQARLWRYHKPAGLVTTNRDPEGRPTIFGALPPGLPRVITVGRLDLNTEGLLLLTNDGELARALELPATGMKRTYRARAFGKVEQKELDRLRDGIEYDGETYRSIIARLDRVVGSNTWINMTLIEGKKREARRALESLGLKVNRLIRTSYGPMELGDLPPGAVAEESVADLLAAFGGLIGDKRRPEMREARAQAKPQSTGGGDEKTVRKRTSSRTRFGGAPKERASNWAVAGWSTAKPGKPGKSGKPAARKQAQGAGKSAGKTGWITGPGKAGTGKPGKGISGQGKQASGRPGTKPGPARSGATSASGRPGSVGRDGRNAQSGPRGKPGKPRFGKR